MSVGLWVAAGSCLLLALGHAGIGSRWVLPHLRRSDFPATPFGPPSLTRTMLRFTWQIVTVLLLGMATLFAILAGTEIGGGRTLILRWLGTVWLIAFVIAAWDVRRRPRTLVRFPTPILFAVIAAVAWTASM